MTAEIFESGLRLLVERRPFQVFTIELHGGRRFEVDHPGAVAFRGGVAVYVAPGNIPVLFDHESVNMIISEGSNSLT